MKVENKDNELSNVDSTVVSKDNSKVKKLKIAIISIITFILIVGTFFAFNSKVTDISIEVVDTNSSISNDVDKFIKENEEKAGVHSLRSGEYTYVLIVSEKEKATEMSINLYDIYKKGFNVNIEYEVEVNESTISENNPERTQRMLVRFKESGNVKPIITKMEEK